MPVWQNICMIWRLGCWGLMMQALSAPLLERCAWHAILASTEKTARSLIPKSKTLNPNLYALNLKP